MRTVLIIFRKEMKDMLRDRRTMFFMVFMPFIAIFLVFNLTMRMGMEMESRAREKVMRVAVISQSPVPDFMDLLQGSAEVEIVGPMTDSQVSPALEAGEIDFAVRFTNDFDSIMAREGTASVDVYYMGSVSENEGALPRIRAILEGYGESLLHRRLEERSLASGFARPLSITEKDVSSARARIGERLGGMIPYFIILFCFMGAMYPAIDLAAGEKERGTIETLLISPASRGQIVVAKWLVVTLAGVFTAVASFAWLFLVLRYGSPMPREMVSGVMNIIEPGTLLLFLAMLIPLCAFFGALLLSVSIFARTYKEAQSIITPLNFIVLIPLLIGIFPGVRLNWATALIPLLNISLATKEIIAGTINPLHLVEVFSVLLVLAVAGLYFCSRWFRREEVIFRGA
ncbi:MAG: ABC transporter permease [Candidatus Fermentibacteraceae bacterium]